MPTGADVPGLPRSLRPTPGPGHLPGVRILYEALTTTARDPDRTPTPAADVRSLPRFAAGAMDIESDIVGTGEDLDRDTAWEPHSHPTHELLWNARGASTATIRSRTWTITPHLGLWIPAGVPHVGWAPSGTWHRAAQLSLRTGALASDPVPVEVTPLLRLVLDRLRDPGLPDPSRRITEAMVLDLLRPTDLDLVVTVPEDPLLRPVADAVRRDPADRTTLARWAERQGVSTRTLTRAFVVDTGLAFRPWVARVRAQRALALLADGTDLAEVSRAVGYRSPSAFIAAFRRLTGTTPTRFHQP